MAIQLSKNGNAVKFDFDDNSHYLNDGTIEVPVNSLTLVTDESDMFTFKKAASDDIFISGLYEEIGMSKSELIAWYKDNMVGSTGGGGGGVTSGWVENYVEGALEPYAESSAVTEEISEAVSGKQDTLIAGTNITISGNVISAEGGGGSINVVQTTGTSTGDVMSQSAVTKSFNQFTASKDSDDGSVRFWTWKTPDHPYGNNTLWNFSINGRLPLSQQTRNSDYAGMFNFHLVETSAITSSVTSASTDSQVPSAKAVYDALQEGGGGGITPEEVEEMIDEAVSGKADSSDVQTLSGKLATDEEVIARALVDLQKVDVIEEVTSRGLNQLNSALGGLKLVQLTQAEYNALTTKDASTLYFIVLPPEPQYRWVDDGANTICGDGDEYDSCNLYQRTKKQVSLDSGQTWSDVSPAEYGYGDIIEEDSQECGCGSGCREIDLADEQGEDYFGELVQGIKFGWIAVSPGTQETVYIWDYNETEYIGKVTCVVDNEDEAIKTVYIYDDSDTLFETINDYAEWDDWIELCNYFEGSCMKLSLSQEDEDRWPSDGFPIIIKVDSGENCDCGCLDE